MCIVLVLSLASVTLEEAECSKARLEIFQRLQRRGRSKPLRHALLHGLRWSHSVQLLRDEVLYLPKTIEPPRHRVFDDKAAFVSLALTAEDQVASEFGCLDCLGWRDSQRLIPPFMPQEGFGG